VEGSSWQSFVSISASADEAQPEEWSRPGWVGAPPDELGHAVDLGLVLARSETGVVALSYALAFSTGIVLNLVAQVRNLTRGEANRVMHEHHMGAFEPDEEPPPAFLRVGIELADGSRASTSRIRTRARAHSRATPRDRC